MTKSLTNSKEFSIFELEIKIIDEKIIKQLNIRDIDNVYGVEKVERKNLN